MSGQIFHPERPFEKIRYAQQPIWHAPAYLEAMVSDTSDGYNRIGRYYNNTTKIIGNEIYLGYATHHYRELYSGFLIEKRKLDDGELLWQKVIDLSISNRQEVLIAIEMDADSNLMVISYKRIAPYKALDPGSFNTAASRLMILERRYLDKDSGEIMQNYSVDINDTEQYICNHSNLPQPRFYTYLKRIDQHYTLVHKMDDNIYNNKYNVRITKDSVNTQGYKFGRSDTLTFDSLRLNFEYIPMEDEKFLFVHGEINDTSGNRDLVVFHINNEFRIEKKIKIKNFTKRFRLNYLGKNKDSLYFLNKEIYGSFNDSVFYTIYSYSLKDESFTVLHQIVDYENELRDIKYIYSDTIMSYFSIVGITGDTTRNNAAYFYLDIVSINQKTGLKEAKRMVSEDYLRFIQVNGWIEHENKVILRCSENTLLASAAQSTIGRIDNNAWAQSSMLWDKSRLVNKISSTSPDIQIKIEKLNFFPNPTFDILNIKLDLDCPQTTIKFFDFSGKLLKIDKDFHADQNLHSYDLSTLQSGFYFCHIFCAGKTSVHKIVKY